MDFFVGYHQVGLASVVTVEVWNPHLSNILSGYYECTVQFPSKSSVCPRLTEIDKHSVLLIIEQRQKMCQWQNHRWPGSMGGAVDKRSPPIHLYDPSSIPVLAVWVEFAVRSRRTPRFFLQVLRFPSLNKTNIALIIIIIIFFFLGGGGELIISNSTLQNQQKLWNQYLSALQDWEIIPTPFVHFVVVIFTCSRLF